MSQENDIEQSMTAGDVGGVLADQSDVLLDTDGGEHFRETHDEQWQERESRNALKHVAGLGEIQDVTEVEYRKVRLERVVLVGVWSSRETTQAAAEESLRELAALAETAGAVVCDGLLQHRIKPDAATYVGSGKARELAGIVAQEMGVQIRITSGPAIEKPGDLAALLTNLQEGDILFIDEIHRLSRQVEEVLYPALEDFALDIMIGKGPSAQSIRINLPRFTLVGATTRAGQLTGPLRDRFGILLKLELYSPKELGRIIMRSAGILGVPITEEGALELARCARGTPRIANRMLKRARDFATVQGDGTIDGETAIAARKWMDIDELGLDELDRSLLRAIIEMYNGGPVGLDTLAAVLGEESVTLYDVCEPYLMQMGMLTRTPRGRCVTRLAYEHLHMAVPKRFDEEDSGQTSMF